MSRKPTDEDVKRRLYSESMGKCMNPNCKADLFRRKGDVIEKAHIVAYCETEDNSFDNLVILCPTCHTDFDKNNLYTSDEVGEWKRIRKQELAAFFAQKYNSFEELCRQLVPLLSENKMIYEKYYLGNQRKLWDEFEPQILVNNRKIKLLLENNMSLLQANRGFDNESSQEYAKQLLLHIDEFEKTRGDDERIRAVFFPKEINSIFGISPVHDGIVPMTEALEVLISKTECKEVVLGVTHPYIVIRFNDQDEKIYLDDGPRLKQLYYTYGCFRKTGVRLESLNFALKYLKNQGVHFSFCDKHNIREIKCLGYHIIYVYEYCLSRNDLEKMQPNENAVIVNLHNWNGESCISKEAYDFAKKLDVKLLTMDDYYDFIKKNK